MQGKAFWIGLGVVAAVLVAGVVFLGRGTGSKVVSPTGVPLTPTPTPEITDGSASDDQAVKEITVTAKEFSFSPASISLKVGDKVKLTFKNEGKMEHNFVIDELEVETIMVSPGEEDTVEFEVTEKMEVSYYCSVGSHRQLGMEGKLIVE
jgi:plastocyanin